MGHVITPIKPTATVKLVDVPGEVSAELSDLYDYLADHPAELAHVRFDTADEKAAFIAQARSWAAQQTDIEFRLSKNLSDTEATFRLRPPLTEEEKEANRAKNTERKAKADQDKLAAEKAALKAPKR